MTPLLDVYSHTYGDEIDVSDRIEIGGVGNITRSLDSSDYSLGIFNFADLNLKGYNFNGYFNDETDSRSIFQETRDLAKVRVVFEYSNVTRTIAGEVTDAVTTDTVTFRGLINEEGTRIDAVTDLITFKVLSRDSVFRTTKIPAGVVTTGVTIKTALESILDQPKITSVLNFSASDIDPFLNVTIDDGTVFDNIPVNDGLNQLLLVSNSVLFINDAGDIFVRSRDEDMTTPILNLYGKSDQLARENIIRITAYNLGIHRTFTSFLVNDTEVNNVPLQQTYGFRQKKISIDFITDNLKEMDIAQSLLDEFSSPRIELNVQVATSLVKDSQLLDRVSVNYPLRVKPIEGKFLPIVGTAVIGDPDTPLPYVFGSISIMPTYGFKIIEINDNPQDFTTILKLRQINDFVFNAPGNSILGFAVIGSSTIGGTGSLCDAFLGNPIGAASIGCTVIG